MTEIETILAVKSVLAGAGLAHSKKIIATDQRQNILVRFVLLLPTLAVLFLTLVALVMRLMPLLTCFLLVIICLGLGQLAYYCARSVCQRLSLRFRNP